MSPPGFAFHPRKLNTLVKNINITYFELSMYSRVFKKNCKIVEPILKKN
jgi:hypothetical protein